MYKKMLMFLSLLRPKSTAYSQRCLRQNTDRDAQGWKRTTRGSGKDGGEEGRKDSGVDTRERDAGSWWWGKVMRERGSAGV